MTDPTVPGDDAAARQARIEALQRRRTARPGTTTTPTGTGPREQVGRTGHPGKRTATRAHPAAGARRVAAGVGVTALFGLVAGMGVAGRDAGTAPTTPEAPTVVVVPPPTVATSGTAGGQVVAAPVALAPAPVVRTADGGTEQAQVARTHGSR